MAITAADVNKLRHHTGAGMMDCKKALEEAGGNFDDAIDILRKKGQKILAKRADREANEGVVVAKTNDKNTRGIIIKLTSETDFVAKNSDFIAFAQQIADIALDSFPKDIETLKSQHIDGQLLAEKLDEQLTKIGEKIDIGEYVRMEGECVVAYNHAGNRIAVLVALNASPTEVIAQAGKDVAMQIAAMNPVAIDENSVGQGIIDKELDIARDLIRQEGKPQSMVEKIAQGKLQKFFKEGTLLNQAFVKNPSQTVRQMLNDVEKGLTVVDFKRVAIGG